MGHIHLPFGRVGSGMDGCDAFERRIEMRSVDLKETEHVSGGTLVRAGHGVVRPLMLAAKRVLLHKFILGKRLFIFLELYK